MKNLGAILLVAALVLGGCASTKGDKPGATTKPASSDTAVANQDASPGATLVAASPGGPQAFPSCFAYHDPRAQGPGPSHYSFEVYGPQPLFAGSAVRVIGKNWGTSSTTVQLILLPGVQNAMWYGTKPDLMPCLGPVGRSIGQAQVRNGVWEWEGTVPSLQEGSTPVLVAVDQLGTYYLSALQMYGAAGLVKPYTLAVGSDNDISRGTGSSEPLPPVQPITVGAPFRLTGSGLPQRSGPVRIHLDYHDDKGGDWILLGSGQLNGDRLETDQLRIPEVLDLPGAKRSPEDPATYRLVITNDERPYQIYYMLSIQLLPAKSGGA